MRKLIRLGIVKNKTSHINSVIYWSVNGREKLVMGTYSHKALKKKERKGENENENKNENTLGSDIPERNGSNWL